MHLSFLPKPPPPDAGWLRHFTLHLLRLAPKLDISSRRQLGVILDRLDRPGVHR